MGHVYSAPGDNYCQAFQQTADGGYLLAGYTVPVTGNRWDWRVVKTDSVGNQQWVWEDSASAKQQCWVVTPMTDGTFLLGGYRTLTGDDRATYLAKMSMTGDTVWTKVIGDTEWNEECRAIVQTPDGGVAIGSYKFKSGQGSDFWLAKFGAEHSRYIIRWTDFSGGSWFDWNNWNPARIPEAIDTVFITHTGDYTVTVPANAETGRLILGSGLPDDTTVQALSVNCLTCSLTIYDNSLINTNGRLTAGNSARVVLQNNSLTLTDSGEVALSGSSTFKLGATNTLDIAAGSLGLTDYADITDGALVRNSGRINRSGSGTSTITANYQDVAQPADTTLNISGGMLVFNSPDSAIFISNVIVASGSELAIQHAQFRASATVSGEGSLSLTAGNPEIASAFPFSGDLTISAGSLNFHPSESISLDTLSIESGASFSSPAIVNVAVVQMAGNTLSSNLAVYDRFDWTAGQFLGSPGSLITIDATVDLSISGSDTKVLDTRDLVINGSAAISGPGVLSLINGASVMIGSNGSLVLGDYVTISAPLDTLINQGEITIQSPLDTCVLDLFLWNNPEGRTPGTVDILSDSRATMGRVRNDGTVKLNENAQLRVYGSYLNGALSDLREGAVCFLNDALTNLPSGIVYLAGDAAITGSGVIENSGSIYRQSGGGRTESVCNITTEFHNLSGTGYLAVEVDTLALTNPVSDNAGTIDIFTNATLQVASTFENLPGGVITGGGEMSIVIRNLTILRSGNSVQLQWTRVPGEVQYYQIYRATEPSEDIGDYSVIGTLYYDEELTVYSFTTSMGSRERAFYRVVVVR